jgi:hypothetical protein
MLYLIQAGADIYGAPPDGGSLAVSYALVGTGIEHRPFVEGVKLLLAAGFDPRCPAIKNGLTAMEVKRAIKYDAKYAPGNVGDQHKLLKLLTVATNIAERRNPGNPDCGGLEWIKKQASLVE